VNTSFSLGVRKVFCYLRASFFPKSQPVLGKIDRCDWQETRDDADDHVFGHARSAAVHPCFVRQSGFPMFMHKHDLVYLTEDASHAAAIDIINEEAFGPGRFARAAARIREQGPHDRSLSFICADDGETIGSVRMTPVFAGPVHAHLLGPLAVRPSHKNRGIGRELVRIAVEAARRKGSQAVILVGDAAYYQPLGFEPVSYGGLDFPGPVDPARVLAVSMADGVHARLRGAIRWRG
jgi:predicted N-acetyltransferase YhbS